MTQASIPLTREQALDLLKSKCYDEYLIKHSLASEAIMRALARKLGKDEELWGITALLHDLDFSDTKDTPSRHALETVRILGEMNFPEESIQAIKAHNAEEIGAERKSEFDYALSCAETITGLIVATALVQPEKKLEAVKVKSIMKRMKERAFARKVNREIIMECPRFGMELRDFVELSLNAMKDISGELGL